MEEHRALGLNQGDSGRSEQQQRESASSCLSDRWKEGGRERERVRQWTTGGDKVDKKWSPHPKPSQTSLILPVFLHYPSIIPSLPHFFSSVPSPTSPPYFSLSPLPTIIPSLSVSYLSYLMHSFSFFPLSLSTFTYTEEIGLCRKSHNVFTCTVIAWLQLDLHIDAVQQ